MRPVVLPLLVLFAAPPPAMALELDGSQWVSPLSGLHAAFTRQGDTYELRSGSGTLLESLRGNVPPRGTLLLRMRMTGHEFSGTAFVFAPGCTFPYSVKGTLRGSLLFWSGNEPKDREKGTCRVTRSAFTTHMVRLVWAPVPPAPIAKRAEPPRADIKTKGPAKDVFIDSSAMTHLFLLFLIAGSVVITGRLIFRVRSRALRLPDLPPRPMVPEPSRFASPLPSRSGKWRGTRTELMRSDAEFVAAHKELLLERIEQHQAYAGLIRERLKLAALLTELWSVPSVINNPNPNAKTSDFSLSLDEINRMLDAMNIEPDLRAAIMRMLTGRLQEKIQ